MIGYKCKIKNEYGIIFSKILQNISSKEYEWKLIDEEVFDEKGEFLFSKNSYENEEFQKLINKIHYVTFANIQLYTTNDEIIPISSFEDFLKSNCKLLLTIVDCEFLKIYAKDKKILETLIINTNTFKFSDINYIYQSNIKDNFLI